MVFQFLSKYKLPLVGVLVLGLLLGGENRLGAQDNMYADSRTSKRLKAIKVLKIAEPEPMDFDEMSSLSSADLRRKLAGILPELEKKSRRRLFQQLQEWRPDWFEHWEDVELFPDSTTQDTMPQRLRFELVEEGEKFIFSWHGGGLTYGYGPRNGHLHKGWDTPLEIGDTIVSLMNGVVRYAKFNHSGYGNCVMVRHFNGLETLYGHLDRIDVEPGDLVAAGEPLGLGGNSGKSTGPHLHFEVRYAGFAMDPALLMTWTDQGPKIKTAVLEINKSQLSSEKGGEGSHGSHGSAQASNHFHRIRAGETLSSIARKYHTTLGKLKKMNRLTNADFIREGQRIQVR